MKKILTAAFFSTMFTAGGSMAGTFVDNLTKLIPDGVTLAPELVTTFDWMEDQGWMHIRDGGAPEDHWMSIYPADITFSRNASEVHFGGTVLKQTSHWSTPNADVDARLVEIATTSGDGGRVLIWRDETDTQWFVHMGHDTLGIISKDPIVMLQFLAMGYLEPGGLDRTNLTPEQAAMEYYGFTDPSEFGVEDVNEQPAIAPKAFQAFLASQFDATMPATARDLGIADFDYYGDEKSKDRFVQWMIKVTPPPTEAELAYVRELEQMVEDLDLEDMSLEDLDFENEEPKGFFAKLKGLLGSNK